MKKDHKVEEVCDLFIFYVSKRENFIAFFSENPGKYKNTAL